MIRNGINPTQNVYFVGASIIRHFNESGKFELDFNELYLEIQRKYNCSIKLFWLGLTWLYVLGVVDTNESGDIKYVS